jgi:hypothetical protein
LPLPSGRRFSSCFQATLSRERCTSKSKNNQPINRLKAFTHSEEFNGPGSRSMVFNAPRCGPGQYFMRISSRMLSHELGISVMSQAPAFVDDVVQSIGGALGRLLKDLSLGLWPVPIRTPMCSICAHVACHGSSQIVREVVIGA